ncbi:hypothetical protein NL511_30570, partial [Klebsiella pneumoniae]|nr:hypothetical protein [Klebsiella pneumoniae]
PMPALPCAVAAIAQMTSGSAHAAERRYFNVRDDVKFRFPPPRYCRFRAPVGYRSPRTTAGASTDPEME